MNIISVDLEDWFDLGFAEKEIARKKNNFSEPIVVRDTLVLLSVFKKYNIRATFFILGRLAKEYPDLVRQVAQDGHEIASHGYNHLPIARSNPNNFDEDIKKSLEAISKLTQDQIIGYRAPHLSLRDYWAYDILSKNGFLYDSSLKFPLAHLDWKAKEDYYALSLKDGKEILEFPVSSINFLGRRIAFSGGAYFRMLPKLLIKKCIENINNKGLAAHIYLHPRDVAKSLPSLRLSFANQLRYSGRSGDTLEKLEYLLANFKFGALKMKLEGRATYD